MLASVYDPTSKMSSVYDRANHSGTQSADTLTDGTTNKAFLATERTKLSGIATAATANATDAELRDRSTHTGTQLAATISDFSTAVLLTAYSKATVDSNIATAIGTRAALTGATFSGAISATNLSGINSGDETTASIKTKL